MPFSAYIVCTTPRSGSTLLCDMLSASGVAGQPQSYFRSQDLNHWASLWGIGDAASSSDQAYNRAYLSAMMETGSGTTGVFGLRLMWSSVSEAIDRISAAVGSVADPVRQFERAFGPTLFIHLSRRDKLAQAVSLVKAQQTGLWHVAADGSERQRVAPPQPPSFDREAINSALDLLQREDAAWSAFFSERQLEPYRLWYEELEAEPQANLAAVLISLGRDAVVADGVSPQTAKMADATSAVWTRQVGRCDSPSHAR